MTQVKLNVGKENKDRPILEGYSIKNKALIPEYTINYTTATETNTDAEGTPIGFTSSLVRSEIITLRPEEFYESRSDADAKENGKKAKNTS